MITTKELQTLPLDVLKKRLDLEKNILDDANKIYELRKEIEEK
jgi:hypothetical protein